MGWDLNFSQHRNVIDLGRKIYSERVLRPHLKSVAFWLSQSENTTWQIKLSLAKAAASRQASYLRCCSPHLSQSAVTLSTAPLLLDFLSLLLGFLYVAQFGFPQVWAGILGISEISHVFRLILNGPFDRYTNLTLGNVLNRFASCVVVCLFLEPVFSA